MTHDTHPIEDLLKITNEPIKVWKRDNGTVCVKYEHGEILDGDFLRSTFGCGRNFEEACTDYLLEIMDNTMIFNARSSNPKTVVIR